ncbi:MAG: hypothetical protein ABFQ53_01535 [Patescibacteria group bacterium]
MEKTQEELFEDFFSLFMEIPTKEPITSMQVNAIREISAIMAREDYGEDVLIDLKQIIRNPEKILEQAMHKEQHVLVEKLQDVIDILEVAKKAEVRYSN